MQIRTSFTRIILFIKLKYSSHMLLTSIYFVEIIDKIKNAGFKIKKKKKYAPKQLLCYINAFSALRYSYLCTKIFASNIIMCHTI
ncbi:unnamed protein product [Blepharisma stoltei]|uniref:Uncharacterized protein n=1 Tax=Blepharisma stoltei TaxID=1481888 RepID=A0AAU9J2Z2_9CILI|nr:unnamed protein product [Blepharisma stoltei]